MLLEIAHEKRGREEGCNAGNDTRDQHSRAERAARPFFSSFGTSSTPAPRMTGVASRKEKRAASLWVRPASTPPTMVAPEREMPGISAAAWQAPMTKAVPQPTCASGLTPDALPRRRNRSPKKQDEAIDDQAGGGQHRTAEKAAQDVFQREAENNGGEGGDDDEAKDAAFGCHYHWRADAQHRLGETQPVAPEIEQQGNGGTEMQHDEEGQEIRRLLVDRPAQQAWQDDSMAKAADWKTVR